jgi:hypothetical protein
MLISCLSCSSALKMEAICSSESFVTFQRGVISPKTELFLLQLELLIYTQILCWCVLCELRLPVSVTPLHRLFPLKKDTTQAIIASQNRHCKKGFSYPWRGVRGSVVVKALCYKPEGRGFDSQWGEFLNLLNLSGRTMPWGLLSL